MTSGRAYADYLHDILDHAEKAQQFTAGVDFDAFCANAEKTMAVVRALEVVGEAAKHVPESVRQRYPEVPWRNIVGMRDVLIHHYFGVDLEVVWKTVHRDLPALRMAVERILTDLEAAEE
jgi:uncharacterized protein with HEPN domain